MKILACYFRENQAKFFGKRGVSLLGFMIITNSRDEEARAKGEQNVKFCFYVTDDTKQDEWSVLAAKADLYSNISRNKFQRFSFKLMVQVASVGT